MIEREELIRRRDNLNQAIEAATALDWLLQYGHQGLERAGFSQGHKIEVRLELGSSCTGNKEALRYLNDAAQRLGQNIIEHAIANAEAAIASVEEAS